jgi:hypothetical protein
MPTSRAAARFLLAAALCVLLVGIRTVVALEEIASEDELGSFLAEEGSHQLIVV